MPIRPALPPNTSPSGRSINPATGRIASMPGGSDYLAGIGPAPAGLSAADMADPAAIIHGVGLPGRVNPQASQLIRQNYPQGFGNLFNAFNALGYKPPTASSPLNNWYQNGLWGGPTAGAVYNPAVAGSGQAAPPTPIQNALQTPFTPTGSANPTVNASLMGKIPATPTTQTPGLNLAPSGIQTPGITWAGTGGPYSQMSQNYKQMTAGLTPAQILAKFKGP